MQMGRESRRLTADCVERCVLLVLTLSGNGTLGYWSSSKIASSFRAVLRFIYVLNSVRLM